MTKDIKKTNAARRLDDLGISYQLVQFDVDEADLSAETAAEAIGMPYEQVYKTLVVRGDKTGIMEVCLPEKSWILSPLRLFPEISMFRWFP